MYNVFCFAFMLVHTNKVQRSVILLNHTSRTKGLMSKENIDKSSGDMKFVNEYVIKDITLQVHTMS